MVAVMAATGLVLSVATAAAQNSPAASQAVNSPVPQLAYGVPQVLQLTQAKVNDDTIIAYIKNSGNSYGLNADQIIYLRQQGVSDAVLTAMLTQPKAAVSAPAPQPAASTAYAEPSSTATVAPAVTYVQTVPATVYYTQPYYYPAYGWYPPVSFSFGWGWGGGWHGGGWHGGGHR